MLLNILGVLLKFVVRCRKYFVESLRPDGNVFAKELQNSKTKA